MQGERARAAQRSFARGAAQRTGLQQKLHGALDADPELAPGIERSMVRAFWSRAPLAAGVDPQAIAGLVLPK